MLKIRTLLFFYIYTFRMRGKSWKTPNKLKVKSWMRLYFSLSLLLCVNEVYECVSRLLLIYTLFTSMAVVNLGFLMECIERTEIARTHTPPNQPNERNANSRRMRDEYIENWLLFVANCIESNIICSFPLSLRGDMPKTAKSDSSIYPTHTWNTKIN